MSAKSFWSLIAIGQPWECWPYVRHDYRFHKNNRSYRPHRFAFEIHHGRAILPNHVVKQMCGHKKCCNPNHLSELDSGEHGLVKRADLIAVGVRFWSHVEVGRPDECWPFLKSTNPRSGYGQFHYPYSRSIDAHRFAYIFSHGSIPAGNYICHRCDNPPCVNPAHLFAGTQADNLRDMWNKGRGKLPPQKVGQMAKEIHP